MSVPRSTALEGEKKLQALHAFEKVSAPARSPLYMAVSDNYFNDTFLRINQLIRNLQASLRDCS